MRCRRRDVLPLWTGAGIVVEVIDKPVRTIGDLEDLSTLPPEFVARIRRRGRELLTGRGIAVPPEE